MRLGLAATFSSIGWFLAQQSERNFWFNVQIAPELVRYSWFLLFSLTLFSLAGWQLLHFTMISGDDESLRGAHWVWWFGCWDWGRLKTLSCLCRCCCNWSFLFGGGNHHLHRSNDGLRFSRCRYLKKNCLFLGLLSSSVRFEIFCSKGNLDSPLIRSTFLSLFLLASFWWKLAVFGFDRPNWLLALFYRYWFLTSFCPYLDVIFCYLSWISPIGILSFPERCCFFSWLVLVCSLLLF